MIRLIVDRDRINIRPDIAKVQLNLRAHIHTSHSCTVLSIPAKIIGTLFGHNSAAGHVPNDLRVCVHVSMRKDLPHSVHAHPSVSLSLSLITSAA